jgi:hypothetical protein
MNAVIIFFKKGTEQFRWRYFSCKRMCSLSLFLFIFFIGWRLLFQKEAAEELASPRLFRHFSLAIFMGFISAFSKPPETETD